MYNWYTQLKRIGISIYMVRAQKPDYCWGNAHDNMTIHRQTKEMQIGSISLSIKHWIHLNKETYYGSIYLIMLESKKEFLSQTHLSLFNWKIHLFCLLYIILNTLNSNDNFKWILNEVFAFYAEQLICKP